MPEIYIHAVKGRTLDQKRALVKDITDAERRLLDEALTELREYSHSPKRVVRIRIR